VSHYTSPFLQIPSSEHPVFLGGHVSSPLRRSPIFSSGSFPASHSPDMVFFPNVLTLLLLKTLTDAAEPHHSPSGLPAGEFQSLSRFLTLGSLLFASYAVWFAFVMRRPDFCSPLLRCFLFFPPSWSGCANSSFIRWTRALFPGLRSVLVRVSPLVTSFFLGHAFVSAAGHWILGFPFRSTSMGVPQSHFVA